MATDVRGDLRVGASPGGTAIEVEEARLQRVPAALLGRYDEVVARGDGARLWAHAVKDVQGGHFDDRPLYWARLKLRQLSRETGRDGESAERAARGFDGDFQGSEPRVLLTGFDPFHLDRNIAQSNPSGLAALALDGTLLAGARIRTAILPVSFAAFDKGIVEELLTPHFVAGLRLLLTVSMGRDAFDLERFPGLRRSAKTPDNGNVASGGSPEAPQVPAGLEGPEFLEFSLPARAMAATPGRWAVRDNRRVTSLERGPLTVDSLADLARDTAVAGSGGGYLSNEVAYRALRLRERLGATFAVGHVHTPRVDGYDVDAQSGMLAQIRDLVGAAVAGLRDNG